jgi:hypothetical protein
MLRLYLVARPDTSLIITQRITDAIRARYRDVQIISAATSPSPTAYAQQVEDTMRTCNAALVVIGQDWLEARSPSGLPWQQDPYDPVALAIQAAMRQKKLIVPLLVHGAIMPPDGALAPSLEGFARHQAVTVREDPWFQMDLDKVYSQLNTQLRWRPASWLLLSTTIGIILAFILTNVFIVGLGEGAKGATKGSPLAGFTVIGVLFEFVFIGFSVVSLVIAFVLASQRKQIPWLAAMILMAIVAIPLIVGSLAAGAQSVSFGAALILWQCVATVLYIIFALFGKRREMV